MRRVRPGYLVAFLVLAVVVIVPTFLRRPPVPAGPSVVVVDTDGRERTITRDEIDRLPELCRRGEYQNQYENWRDEGVYCGPRLIDLLGEIGDYVSVVVVAVDGYRVEIERWRIEDEAYPLVLAHSFEGRSVPDWPDGYRIAVLPEDGSVSNADYGVVSAGSYWVKNVVRLLLQPE